MAGETTFSGSGRCSEPSDFSNSEDSEQRPRGMLCDSVQKFAPVLGGDRYAIVRSTSTQPRES